MTLAVDLDPVSIRARINADKAAAHAKAEALVAVARLDQRIDYLARKHARLPIGNGKRKARKEAIKLQATRDAIKAASL